MASHHRCLARSVKSSTQRDPVWGSAMVATADEDKESGETSRSAGKDNALPINTNAPPAPPPPSNLYIGPLLVMVLNCAAFVLIVASIGIPWYQMEQFEAGPKGEGITETFYLWKTVKWVGNNKRIEMSGNIPCPAVRYRVVCMQIFSIISSCFLLIAAIISVFNYRARGKNACVRNATIATIGVLFIVLTVHSSLSYSVFHQSFEDCKYGMSYHGRLYEPYVGFGFTVSAWVMTAVAGLFSYTDPRIPNDAGFVEFSRKSYALLSLASLLLAAVACCTPHWYYKNGLQRTVTDVFLWKQRHGILWGVGGATNSTFTRDLGCTSIVGCFHAAEAFSIASIFFLAGSALIGILLCKKLSGSTLPSIVFGFAASLVTFVQWVFELVIYYGDFCNGMYAYSRQKYLLTVGFALTVASFVGILFASAILLLGEMLRLRYYVSKVPSKTIKEIIIEMSQ